MEQVRIPVMLISMSRSGNYLDTIDELSDNLNDKPESFAVKTQHLSLRC